MRATQNIYLPEVGNQAKEKLDLQSVPSSKDSAEDKAKIKSAQVIFIAVCKEPCQNNGTCILPGVCGCPAEYRGPHCEFHFLNCDIRKLAGKTRIRWVCTHKKNESVCRIKCTPSHEFETSPAEEYKCDPQGKWTPDFIPKCIEKAEDQEKEKHDQEKEKQEEEKKEKQEEEKKEKQEEEKKEKPNQENDQEKNE